MKASDLMAASGWKSESIAQFPFARRRSRWGAQMSESFRMNRSPLSLWTRRDIPQYWGFQTEIVESLEGYLATKYELDSYMFLTSRKGKGLTPEILSNMGHIGQKRDLAVVFGSPARGVDAFLSKESDRYEMINTIPHQGTETVRVEEAVFATSQPAQPGALGGLNGNNTPTKTRFAGLQPKKEGQSEVPKNQKLAR